MTLNPGSSENSQQSGDNWEHFNANSVPINFLSSLLSEKKQREIQQALHQQSFLDWKKDADIGIPRAQFYVGLSYEIGQGVERSFEDAFHYYQLSAEQNNVDSQYYLGRLFQKGLGTKQSDQQAFYYYQLAAKQGLPDALTALGICYRDGIGTEKSEEEAFYYLEMAADQQDIGAWYQLSKMHVDGNGNAKVYRKKFFGWLKSKADEGCSEAQVLVGLFYESGHGVEKSLEFAYHYLELAAKTGSPQYMLEIATFLLKNGVKEELAVNYLKTIVKSGSKNDLVVLSESQFELGSCFENGRGIKKSAQNALYYYRLAAENGNISAQERLGRAYIEGSFGVKVSIEMALKYFQSSIDQGSYIALELIGECYEKGNGVEQSFEKAIHYYKLASEKGSYIGLCRAGCCYDQIGGKEAEEKAVECFKLSFENKTENLCSLWELAEHYRIGCGVEKSLETASEYYLQLVDILNKYNKKELSYIYYTAGKCLDELDSRKYNEQILHLYKLAADNGFADAQYSLGRLYEFDMKKSDKAGEIALKYYLQASENGSCLAKYKLASLYEKGKIVNQNYQKTANYYQILADEGYIHALFELSRLYEKGLGVTQSSEKMFMLRKKAADFGHAECQYLVGLHYLEGLGTEAYPAKAIDYFKLATGNGASGEEKIKSMAYLQLAQCYDLGNGVPQSTEEAFKFYSKAADLNNEIALYRIGCCYYHGTVVKESKETAFNYFKRAAELKLACAQYWVGYCYYYGYGVEESLDFATLYFQRAANGGDERAYSYLNTNPMTENAKNWFKSSQKHVSGMIHVEKIDK